MADTADRAMSVHDRRLLLAGCIRRQRGPWTTARALRTYRAAGVTVSADTARADLGAHATAGLLTRHRDRGITYYYAPKEVTP